MAMTPFVDKCPDLGFKETRSATVLNDPRVPAGEYGFLESYCDEPDCDCRRVFINVIAFDKPGRIMATISYGWESAAFYRKWAGYELTADDLEELQGPALAMGNRQSELAPALLILFKTVLQDRAYEARLHQHYKVFKRSLRDEQPAPRLSTSAETGTTSQAVRRNAPCPCGSGKKYKQCHGKPAV